MTRRPHADGRLRAFMCTAALSWLAPVIASPPARAGEEKEAGDAEERLKKFSPPLVVEAAPFSSYFVSALTNTEAWGQTAALYGKRTVGRAEYEQVSGQLSGGFSWSPEKLRRLALGAKFTLLELDFLHTRVPPVIDEWDEIAGLGELSLLVKYGALRRGCGKLLAMLVTPYLRLHLPTETARLDPSRHVPAKLIFGPEVGVSPYVMVEPGAAIAAVLGPATFYASAGLAMGSVIDEGFLLVIDLNFGAAVKVPLVTLVLETGGFYVHRKHHELFAWQVSPGLRFEHGKMRYELGARFGLTENSKVPYGKFTAGLAVHWHK